MQYSPHLGRSNGMNTDRTSLAFADGWPSLLPPVSLLIRSRILHSLINQPHLGELGFITHKWGGANPLDKPWRTPKPRPATWRCTTRKVSEEGPGRFSSTKDLLALEADLCQGICIHYICIYPIGSHVAGIRVASFQWSHPTVRQIASYLS